MPSKYGFTKRGDTQRRVDQEAADRKRQREWEQRVVSEASPLVIDVLTDFLNAREHKCGGFSEFGWLRTPGSFGWNCSDNRVQVVLLIHYSGGYIDIEFEFRVQIQYPAWHEHDLLREVLSDQLAKKLNYADSHVRVWTDIRKQNDPLEKRENLAHAEAS